MIEPFDYTVPKHPLLKTTTLNSNPTSNANPRNQDANPNITKYRQLTLETATESINRRKTLTNNLTISERTTLNKLKKRTDIIIKKADKGDTIVVETTERYIEDGLKHLNDIATYQSIQEDINPTVSQAIDKYLKEAIDKGLLDKDTYQAIKPPSNPRTPIIYFLKKLHKNPVSVRPIVSSVESPTSNLSHFMDILLKPIVKTIPHILTNSTQLLQELDTLTIPDNSILASLDVSSLYTNIPIDEAIDIVLNYLKDIKSPHQPPIELLREILNFILKCNCFSFCNLFYLQIRGVAMGTKMAPNFANIFMTNFEEQHILKRPDKPFFYRRYLDDIFIIWTNTILKLQQLVTDINNCHPTIKLTSEISSESINYLDLTISITNQRLSTSTYFKPTNTFNYLPGNSHHPNSTKRGLAKGEMIRMLRNNSEKVGFTKQSQLIKDKLAERQYCPNVIEQQTPDYSQRNHYLTTTSKKSTEHSITLVTNFDPSIPTSNIIREHWPQLLLEDTLRRRLITGPRICYRAPPTIGKLLTRAAVKVTLPNNNLSTLPTVWRPSSLPARNIKCRSSTCATCPILTNKSHFTSYQKKTYYTINNIYSCDTKNAIYLLECSICQKQYIGETGTTVRVRMRHHRNKFKAKTDLPVYRHLLLHNTDFSAYKLTIIDQNNDTGARKAREMEWIVELKTKIPFGLNIISKLKPTMQSST